MLEPGGRFYAVTPAFPHPEAFADPTHVNIITETTHEYFCGERPLGHMYGFERPVRSAAHRMDRISRMPAAALPERKRERRRVSGARRLTHGVARPAAASCAASPRQGRMGFLVWELQAIKPSGG